uniref:Uncharacterized protein n=1 Tax=Anguilla anguilla TaxID=7936 RepID=A0A0E9XRI5_ANGAN
MTFCSSLSVVQLHSNLCSGCSSNFFVILRCSQLQELHYYCFWP